ncbi:HEAT repeat domain-containing protein [Halomicroarcula sp. GCM10025894]|uniref:HEAT repeat domain-containing protein n=1 Tax=Halomicroarcula sp. GCM10025894 TaxID=3252673 RepID=UPI003616273F
MANVALNFPATARPYTDLFERRLTDDLAEVRRHAVTALDGVGREYPEAVDSAVAELQERYEDDDEGVRDAAAKALSNVEVVSYERTVDQAAPDAGTKSTGSSDSEGASASTSESSATTQPSDDAADEPADSTGATSLQDAARSALERHDE